MFIAIVGTPSSGKRTILEYLVQKHQFQEIKLDSPTAQMDAARFVRLNRCDGWVKGLPQDTEQLEPPSIESLTLTSRSTPLDTPALETPSPLLDSTTITFRDVPTMLDHATKNWKSYLVTTDLRTFADVQPFVKRPFFMLLSVDGPLRTRFVREQRRAEATAGTPFTLERFVDEHDLLLNGPPRSVASASSSTVGERYLQTDFKRVQSLATLSICNDLPDIPSLHAHLDELDLLDEERLRPGWDTYFMTLASLASHRSNCMKRRVGALLVRSKRILSTGYNGTAKGTRNCNEGGCSRCNGSARGGESLNECLCLHAEENALLEAGKDRIGEDSVIYCNTCPCLRCSVKIVQCGVREVVYNQSYSMDEASARVLKEAGVILRQLHLPADMKAALL